MVPAAHPLRIRYLIPFALENIATNGCKNHQLSFVGIGHLRNYFQAKVLFQYLIHNYWHPDYRNTYGRATNALRLPLLSFPVEKPILGG